MALTALESKRIQDVETLLNQLKTLITGASSKSNLNRLRVLCNEEVRRIEERQATIITRLETLITLCEKLQ